MYVFKYVMIYMWYCCVSDFYNFMYCNVMCICEPPSIPNFQIFLLSIVFKIYSHEAEKFNCYPTEDWYLMSWNSLYGSQVFVHNKVIIFVWSWSLCIITSLWISSSLCTISLHSVSAPCMCVRRHTRCSTEVSPRPALLCPAWPSVTGGCSAVWVWSLHHHQHRHQLHRPNTRIQAHTRGNKRKGRRWWLELQTIHRFLQSRKFFTVKIQF